MTLSLPDRSNWHTVRLRPPTRILLERIAQARHDPKIRYILLFGSEARGEATLTSDVDIALVSDEPLSRAERLAFSEVLEDIHFPEVNVINTCIASLNTDRFMDVNYHIKREGVVIYER